jgi:hypothetical protein
MIVQVLDIGGKRPDTVQLIDLFVVSRRCRDDKTMTAAGNVLHMDDHFPVESLLY